MSHTIAEFEQLQSSTHDLKMLRSFMRRNHPAEYKQLESIKSFSNMTYAEIEKEKKSWHISLYSAMLVSTVPFFIASVLFYLSPLMTSDVYGKNEILDYVVATAFGAVSTALLFAIDGTRVRLIKALAGFSDFLAYVFLTVLSVGMSALGVAAISYHYGSTQLSKIEGDIETARSYVASNAHLGGRSLEQITADMTANSEKFHTKGSHWKRTAYNDRKTELLAEKENLNKFLSAQAMIEGKNSMLSDGKSSNVLAHMMAIVIDSSGALAVMILGILVIIGAEIALYKSSIRIGLIDARLGLSNRTYKLANHQADKVEMLLGSSLDRALNDRWDKFYHALGSTPVTVLGNMYDGVIDSTVTPQANVGESLENNHANLENQKGKKKLNSSLGELTLHHFSLEQLKQKHATAKALTSGTVASCPSCDNQYTKDTSSNIFCSDDHRRAYHHIRSLST